MDNFVEKYRISVHRKDERQKVISDASKALDINDEKQTEELLIKSSKKIDDKYIKKWSNDCFQDPVDFVEKHKLRERISKDILPCIVHMDGLGRIGTNNSINNGCELRCLTFTFRMSKDYKVESFRC